MVFRKKGKKPAEGSHSKGEHFHVRRSEQGRRRAFRGEAFNNGNLSSSEELIAPDIVDHDPAPGQAPGREGIEQFVNTIRTAFPDLETTIDEMIGEGDYVAFRYTIEGTHQGEFMGVAPTGKRVSVTAMEMLRFADGKMVDRWGNTDQLGILQQIGALPRWGRERGEGDGGEGQRQADGPVGPVVVGMAGSELRSSRFAREGGCCARISIPVTDLAANDPPVVGNQSRLHRR